MGLVLSAILGKNLDKEAIMSANLWASFTF